MKIGIGLLAAALLLPGVVALAVLESSGDSDGKSDRRSLSARRLERSLERTWRCSSDRREPTVSCRPKDDRRFSCAVTTKGSLGSSSTEIEVDGAHPELSVIC